LSTPSQITMPTGQSPTQQKVGGFLKAVHPCNFRAAGRLSNEDARSLVAMHDSFARQLANVLDIHLSTAVEVKLLTIDQLTLKEYQERQLFFIVSLSLGMDSNHVLIEFERKLVLPMIELLMGGSGQIPEEECELSEIDEEVMNDVVELIIDEVERAWHIPGVAVTSNARIKPRALQRFCDPTEKLTVLRFGVKFAGASGSFDLLLTTQFLMTLLKQIKLDQPQRKTVWRFPDTPVRERILNCEVEVSSELPGLKVAVHDLVALQPGSVLKLRAPIQTPGILSAEGQPMFEAVPVRNGSQRAAHFGRRLSVVAWKRGENANG